MVNINKINKISIIIIIVSSLLFIIFFKLNAKTYFWDEGVYLSNAENLFSDNPYYFEDFRPPLFPFIIKLFSFILDIEKAAIISIFIFYILSVLFTYLSAKLIFKKEIAMLAAIIMVSSLYLLHTLNYVMTEIPCAFFIVLTIYFVLKYEKYSPFVSGVTLTLAILTRYPALSIIPAIVVYYILNKKLREASYFLFSSSLFISLFMFYNKYKFGSYFYMFKHAVGGAVDFQIASLVQTIISRANYFLLSIFLIAGLVGSMGFLLNLYFNLKFKNKEFVKKEGLLYISIIIFFILIIFTHTEIRYIMPIMPLFFILSAKGFVGLKKYTTYYVIFFIMFLLLLIQIHYLGFFEGKNSLGETCKDMIIMEKTCDDTLKKQNDITYSAAKYLINLSYDNKVIYSQSYYPQLAFYTKKKVVTAWPWDDSFYKAYPKNMLYQGYYVHYTNVVKQPSTEWLDKTNNFKKIKEIEGVIIYEYVPSDNSSVIE